MISLEKAGLFPQRKPTAKVFVATVQDELIPNAIEIIKLLRENNIGAEMDLKGRSLSKQLEYVNASKIPYLIVLGRREMESRTLKIKNTYTRTEREIQLNGLVPLIKSLE